MMKNSKKIPVILLSLLILICSIGVSGYDYNSNIISAEPSLAFSQEIVNESGEESSEIKFYIEPHASKMHTDLQLAYLNDDYSNVAAYANGTKELSKPAPITVRWQVSGKLTDGELYVSDDENFTTYMTVPVKYNPNKGNEIFVNNLKVNTKYYCKLKATVKGKTATSEAKTFVTSSVVPRFIDCDGITNMRDLGGYNAKGGIVKQGLIYRCGRLNVSETDTLQVEITANGIKTMQDLGIKSEIDLRLTRVLYSGKPNIREVGGLTDTSVIGDEVSYYQCPMEYANGVSHSENYAEIKNVFAIFANPDNYPIIFHCNIGTDRTGFISYLLNGLLGVQKSDLLRDYLFSNFGKIGSARAISNIVSYVEEIDNCDGSSLSEKVETYLRDVVGVPQEQLDAIKDYLIEKHSYSDTVIREANCQTEGIVLHTCTDDPSLTWTENTGLGNHAYEATSSPDILRCSICGDETVIIVPNVLPSLYTAVDYIESSGTQYINTDFIPNSNTRVVAEIDFKAVSDGKSHNAFSATPGSRDREYGFLCNSGQYLTRYGDDIYLKTSELSYPSKSFVVDMDKNVLKIDGETVYTHVEREFTGGCSMYIFTCNKNGSPYASASLKLYSMQIYDNGTLVRNFVPCYRNADNVIGLWDLVNGKFYTNNGTGAFIYG